jgi:TetR/AcrR family transcriptional regulator, ethionamide resistance regulator
MASVTRKAQTTRQQRREQIEGKLLAATERLMRDGARFTELSVDRLASEAGISRATFYIYFEDKGQLLRQMAHQVFGELEDAAARWWQVVNRHDPTDLHTAITLIIAGYRRHQVVVGALNEMATYDPMVAATYRELLVGISDNLARMIRDGQAHGSMRHELRPGAAASALTWMVERACHQNLPYQPPSADDELAAALTQIIWGALYLEAVGDI